jgi:membrane protein
VATGSNDPGPGDRPGRIARLQNFLTRELWSPEVAGLPSLRAVAYRAVRVLVLAVRGFYLHRGPVHASALTYVTILSLVPFLAFVFAVAKGVGGFDLLYSHVQAFLDTAVPDGTEEEALDLHDAIEHLLVYARETDLSSLGVFGAVVLLYTNIKLLTNVESSFNEIWGIRRARTYGRQLVNYVAIVVVAPILIATASGLAVLVQGVVANLGAGGEEAGEPSRVEQLLSPLISAGPVVLVCLTLAFLYHAIPNTRTRAKSSLLGGVVAGVLWWVTQLLHVQLQTGVARYGALYASFAAIPLLLLWIWISWMVILLGAELAAAHFREPSLRGSGKLGESGQNWRERVGLRALLRIAGAFRSGEPPLSAGELAVSVGVAEHPLEEVLRDLEDEGLLVVARHRWSPARALEEIRISEVLVALRGGPADLPPRTPAEQRIEDALNGISDVAISSAHNISLAELALLHEGAEESDSVEAGPEPGAEHA